MKYSMGLDIGIASIGWSVLDLDKEKIARIGVRTFPKAENPKTGASLALPRREARSVRNRLKQKRKRLDDILRLFAINGLNIDITASVDVYQLRVDGLDEKLCPNDWGKVLYHITKHRGFKSSRKSEAKEESAGKMLSGLGENLLLMKSKKYRTAGEMLYNDVKFQQHKHNKGGEYTNTIPRDLHEEEVKILFVKQRELGNEYATEEIEDAYLEIFKRQKCFASADDLIAKAGKCSLEKNEKRAVKSCYTSELFKTLDKINNMRIIDESGERKLTAKERELLTKEAHDKVSLKYSQVRKKLELADNEKFNISRNFRKNESQEDAEKKVFIEMKSYHEIKKAIPDKKIWGKISKNLDMLDNIAYHLTMNKDDASMTVALTQEFEKNNIDIAPFLSELLNMSFSQFQHLSVKAMRNIIPFMKKGLMYSEACEKAGYDHSCFNKDSEKFEFLSLPDVNEIRNPVVIRSLTQVRKVVNAIIREYGSPYEVHIELARDMSKPFDERRKIETEQNKNREEIEKVKDFLLKEFKLSNPTSGDVARYRLAEEQNYECPYSGKKLDKKKLFDHDYVEIDHISPHSRSFNDSQSNKVIVLSKENRDKGNKTPFEYMETDAKKWDKFKSWVEKAPKISEYKKEVLLKKDFDESKVKDRFLNDTRYITRFTANWIRQTLKFSDEKNKMPVICVNGKLTAILRRKWNLTKKREESDMHHALDAGIVAGAYPYKNNSFSLPYKGFENELKVLLSSDPQETLKTVKLPHYNEEEKANIKPVFVSKMPFRKATGEAHDSTIRSVKNGNGHGCVRTILLDGLKLATLENIVDRKRNMQLYEALKKKLIDNGDNPKKAFAEPFYKPSKNGKQAPIVRSIKVYDNVISGINVRDGFAKNGNMVRVDVFYKDKRHYLVPYYIEDIAKQVRKTQAITNGKEEKDWLNIDDSYKLRFSLFKNDLVKVVDVNGKEFFGYYHSVDRSNSGVKIIAHDNSWEQRGVGVKTCKSFEKYTVSPLGEYNLVSEK